MGVCGMYVTVGVGVEVCDGDGGSECGVVYWWVCRCACVCAWVCRCGFVGVSV